MNPGPILLAAGLLAVFTPAASAQWMWPPQPVYEPYAPRTHHKPALERHARPKPVFHKKERHTAAMSADTERTWLNTRVKSFCGRHPKDVACRPSQQGEPPKEP